jgi:hypothetical protein
VVPYRSAHLDGVESEKVVRSDHGVQKDGEAIREVVRILHRHVGVSVEAARPRRERDPAASAARPATASSPDRVELSPPLQR